MDLKPGTNITVVTGIDSVKERIYVRDAVIYDINGPTITISQTYPPLLRSMVGEEIEITYLVREKNDSARCGFPAEMKEFIDEYPYNPTHKVEAIVVIKKGEESGYNLRMFYRVEPTSRSGLAMTVEGKPVNILDISVGGTKLSCREDFLLPYSSPRTILLIDSAAYPVEVRVLRMWEREIEGLGQKLRFAAIQFLNMNVDLERALSKKIREIEMENLQKINFSAKTRAM
jgi:hypothetical protein